MACTCPSDKTRTTGFRKVVTLEGAFARSLGVDFNLHKELFLQNGIQLHAGAVGSIVVQGNQGGGGGGGLCVGGVNTQHSMCGPGRVSRTLVPGAPATISF